MRKIKNLKHKIAAHTTNIPSSRTHPLKTMNSWTKRDDELGFGISGTKLRKYTSLIPHLKENSYQAAVVVGSAFSNHVLSFTQTLIENRIKPILFLLGEPTMKRQGNLLLTSLLVPQSEWHWISRNEWEHVESKAAEYIRNASLKTKFISEGACMEEALPGALTLAVDLIEADQQYDHIFMDAGTGLSAIATILAFAWLGKKTVIHVLLLADTEQQFLDKLKYFQATFEKFIEAPLHGEMQFKLYQPSIARSFGSVNQTIIDHIKFLAKEEGFFTDPIYSAKLFWEAKEIMKTLTGTSLVIHSGGALTLMGFQKQLDVVS